MLTLIREHRSTLVFANSRRLIERMAGRFIEELEGEGEKAKLKTQNAKPYLDDGGDEEGVRRRRVPVILPHHGIDFERGAVGDGAGVEAGGVGCGAGDEFAGVGD